MLAAACATATDAAATAAAICAPSGCAVALLDAAIAVDRALPVTIVTLLANAPSSAVGIARTLSSRWTIRWSVAGVGRLRAVMDAVVACCGEAPAAPPLHCAVSCCSLADDGFCLVGVCTARSAGLMPCDSIEGCFCLSTGATAGDSAAT